jgi:hypothetical protein
MLLICRQVPLGLKNWDLREMRGLTTHFHRMILRAEMQLLRGRSQVYEQNRNIFPVFFSNTSWWPAAKKATISPSI